mmetsp:Transcript_4790/g.10604  ORF Transcript_4790/g.10604 Transcript_4790/m.10604 type:complete len:237 (-) Transcript_4790:291-1001(-)
MSDQREQSPMMNQQQRRLRGRSSTHQLRRLEDVDYWRKQAGWADDDASMKRYNQGVYNTYYSGGKDDDGVSRSSGSGSDSASTASNMYPKGNMGWILGLAASLIFFILLIKCCSSDTSTSKSSRKSRSGSSAKSRDSSRSLRDKHGDRRSRSRSRARSKSRTRSKSRSRHGEEVVEDYKLMDDGDDRSKKSSRSSRSKRSSRSRSRSRARSKSRPRGDMDSDRERTEKKDNVTMLV